MNDDDFNLLAFIIIFILIIGFLLGFAAGQSTYSFSPEKREAILSGHAHYESNKDGHPVFTWNKD
jgi:hypothetical protein